MNLLSIIGKAIYRKKVVSATDCTVKDMTCKILYIENFPSKKRRSAVCLGDIILVDNRKTKYGAMIEYHELGHFLQYKNMKFKPFYIFKIGIPSFIRSIRSIGKAKKLGKCEMMDWYYNGYPEKEANKLIGIVYDKTSDSFHRTTTKLPIKFNITMEID